MLSRVLKYSFASDAVSLLSSRNTRSSSWDMEKVSGTKKTDSQDGLMSDSPPMVTFNSFRHPRSHQRRKSPQTKRIRVWYLLYLCPYSRHSNLQLCCRRNWLPLYPSDQELETQWETLRSSSGSQQTWNCWKARKRTSANLEKKLRHPSSWARTQRRKTSPEG